jgi:hypothetical protein
VPITEASRRAQLSGLAARAADQRIAALERLAVGAKTCTGCGALLALGDFPTDPDRIDGRRSRCRPCGASAAAALMARLRARRALAAGSRPLPGWELVCCGGQLVDDPELSWWRAVHHPRCRDRWQPSQRAFITCPIAAAAERPP